MRLLTAAPSAAGSTAGAPARTWFAAHPSQRPLLWASLAVGVAAWMPWVSTPVGALPGLQGAGLVTMYVAALGLAGALVRSRRLAGLQGLTLGLTALALGSWQMARLLLLDVEGIGVGIGVPITMIAGTVALRASVRILRG